MTTTYGLQNYLVLPTVNTAAIKCSIIYQTNIIMARYTYEEEKLCKSSIFSSEMIIPVSL
jgi:hypothetical protein